MSKDNLTQSSDKSVHKLQNCDMYVDSFGTLLTPNENRYIKNIIILAKSKLDLDVSETQSLTRSEFAKLRGVSKQAINQGETRGVYPKAIEVMDSKALKFCKGYSLSLLAKHQTIKDEEKNEALKRVQEINKDAINALKQAAGLQEAS